MKINHIIAFLAGLGVFAIGIIAGIMAINNRFPISVLPSIAVVILTLAGFELCHFALSPGENEYRIFSRGYRGLLFDIIIILLAIGLMFATINFKHASKLLCDGRLGAGFPAAFICDASGESPLSGVGKIDWSDLDSLNPGGIFMDILFHLTILWILWKAVRRIFHTSMQRTNSRQ